MKNTPKNAMDATDVENTIHTLLREVSQGDEPVVVEDRGVPMVAIINIKDYEEYRRWRARQALHELRLAMRAEVKQQGLTEEQLHEELKETRREVFQEKYGKRGQ